jgi:hypothetical protein
MYQDLEIEGKNIRKLRAEYVVSIIISAMRSNPSLFRLAYKNSFYIHIAIYNYKCLLS